jgi:hypothetical protein
MKNIQTFDEFVNESVNEGTISGFKLKSLGSKLLTKIKIGSEFVTDRDTYTVTGFGPKANAFQEFEVTDSKGNAKKVKLTAMYTIKLEVADDPRSSVYRREEMLSSINESLNESDDFIMYGKFEWDRKNLASNEKWIAFQEELKPAAPRGYQKDKNGIWISRKVKVTSIGPVNAAVTAVGFDTLSNMIKSIGFTYLKPIGTYMDGTAYSKGDTVIGVDDKTMAVGLLVK